MSQYDSEQSCPDCDTVGTKIITTVGLNFVGDDWSSKNERVARQMKQKAKNQASRQEERKRDGPGVQLAPNVNGERVGSWAEAQNLAKSKGKDTSSYEPLIRKETASKS